MLFYFTATGNSLYAAKQFDEERYSLAREMGKDHRRYEADAIGIVCPLYEFDLPEVVKEFIRGSEFVTDYFYIVITYGAHDGAVAHRVEAFLTSIGKKADYINTVIMLDNALLVFDMDEQRKLDPGKKVDEHLAAIAEDIKARKHYIQPAAKEESEFSEGYLAHREKYEASNEDPLYTVLDNCVGCGICSKVCPMGCIEIQDGRPFYDYTHCAGCMACIQACPQKAIRFRSRKEVNPGARYRNPNITLAELIAANTRK